MTTSPATAPTILLAGLTRRELAAAADALTAAAGHRVTVARRAAGELEADDATPDKRTGAVRVTKVLAEADALERVAEQLRNPQTGPARVVGSAAATPAAPDPDKAAAIGELSEDDRARARRIAAEALEADAAAHPGPALEDPDPAAVADVETGADPEDEPDDGPTVDDQAEAEAAIDLTGDGA